MAFQRASDISFPDETAAATNGNAESRYIFLSQTFLKHNSNVNNSVSSFICTTIYLTNSPKLRFHLLLLLM